MNIGILSYGMGWHVRELLRAAGEKGHAARRIDFHRVQAELPGTSAALADCEVVLVRTMPPGSLEQVVFRMDVLHRLEAAGVRVLNPPAGLETCIDKYLASARLHGAGLPVPPTVVCQDADTALEAFERLGGDVVIKPLFGSEGRGLVRACDRESAWRICRALERVQAVLYLQQFVRHPGWDLRGFVVGDRVLAAMRRHARDDWRTNVAQGGTTEPVSLTAEEERLVLAAARAVRTPVAGVDLLPNPAGGYFVLEVNAVPGWRALGRTTGVDVAAEILAYAATCRS